MRLAEKLDWKGLRSSLKDMFSSAFCYSAHEESLNNLCPQQGSCRGSLSHKPFQFPLPNFIEVSNYSFKQDPYLLKIYFHT
jgi:hypothetical protein